MNRISKFIIDFIDVQIAGLHKIIEALLNSKLGCLRATYFTEFEDLSFRVLLSLH